MNQIELLTKLKREKLVAVIRGESEAQVVQTAEAVVAGGIRFLEITFTIPHAQDVILKLAQKYADDETVVVGAGTCIDAISARLAIAAGAQFVVCPHFDKEIVMLCNRYRVPVFPGATTVQGILECLSYGAGIIKLFPGDVMGPKSIKAFKAPLPQAEFMPTGGVSVENLHDWLDAGAIAVGTGGSLTKGAATGNYADVTAQAQRFVEKVQAYEK